MTGRTLKIVLGVSLALNLFLVSGIAGAVFMWDREASRRAPAAGRQPLRFAGDALPPDHRAGFRQALRAANHEARTLAEAARDGRREAARLFVQPTFDRRAVAAALDRARAADGALRQRLEGVVIDFAAGLPMEERIALAQGLRRAGPLRQPKAPARTDPPSASDQEPGRR